MSIARTRRTLDALIQLLEPFAHLNKSDGPVVTYGIEWAMDVKCIVRQLQEQLAQPQPVRLLRVLEYTGTPAWINDHINRRTVKGTHRTSDRGHKGLQGTIREAIIGETFEVLDRAFDEEDKESIG